MQTRQERKREGELGSQAGGRARAGAGRPPEQVIGVARGPERVGLLARPRRRKQEARGGNILPAC